MPAKKAPAKKTPARRTSAAKKTTTVKPRKKAVSKVSAKDMTLDNIREDELTTQYPSMKKNNFISLIVLALGTLLVVAGIYIQINKEDPSTTPLPNTGSNNAATSTDTGADGSIAVPTGNNTVPQPTNSSTFAVDAQQMVEKFYGHFNNEQFDDIADMYDANFTNVAGLRQYFSPSRLDNRKNNVVGDIAITEVNAVIDHPIVQRNPNAMVVQYKTNYTIQQDGNPRGETWFAYVIRSNEGYMLNGFECQEGCATSPFFQLR